MIPATIHTNQAMMAGQPTNKYWKAFGISIAVEIGFWILFYLIMTAVIANSINSFTYGE